MTKEWSRFPITVYGTPKIIEATVSVEVWENCHLLRVFVTYVVQGQYGEPEDPYLLRHLPNSVETTRMSGSQNISIKH